MISLYSEFDYINHCDSCKLKVKENGSELTLPFSSCWRRPIFPGRRRPSIFGTGELNFRVRNGNGWDLTVINTNMVQGFQSLLANSQWLT